MEKVGDKIWASLPHVASPYAPQGRAGAQLARIPVQVLPVEGQVSENWKASSKNRTTKPLLFYLHVPTDLLRTLFLSYKIPSRALLIPKPPHTRSTKPLQRQRKGPLFPAPEFPGIFSPSGSSAPRCCCFFTHGFAMGFFPLDNRWPHSFYFQKLENEACRPPPPHPPQAEI